MESADFAVIARALVLLGAVAFSFTMLGLGMICVWREYRLVSDFEKLSKFIELTRDANIDADFSNGTLSMARSRPGLIMMAMGAAVLCVCLFQRLEYRSTDHSGSGVEREPGRTTDPVPAVLPNDDEVRLVYDDWLERSQEIAQQTQMRRGAFLSQLAPGLTMQRQPVAAKGGETFGQLAERAYGDEKYGPMVRAFNPSVDDENGIQADTLLTLWYVDQQPLSRSFMREITIMVSTDDPLTAYHATLPGVRRILESDEYKEDHEEFWRKRNIDDGPMSILEIMKAQTGVGWALQPYHLEDDETVGLLARAELGSREFVPFLRLFNPDHEVLGRLDCGPSSQLNAGDEIWIPRAFPR